MVDNDVLLSDCSEAIPAEVSDTLGKASVIRSEDEIGPIVDDQLLSVVETEDPITGKDVRWGGIEPLHQEAAQICRYGRIDREMDHVTAPTSLERRFVKAD